MEPDFTYTSSPWAYFKRHVMFSYKDDYDHFPRSSTASQKIQTVEKVVNEFQSDIKDLISVVYQLLNDERNNRSLSSAVHQ